MSGKTFWGQLVALVLWAAGSISAVHAQSVNDINNLITGRSAPKQESPKTEATRVPSHTGQTSRQLSNEEVAKRGTAATVFIYIEVKEKASSGAGFLISTGQILTNSHVVEGADKIMIVAPDRKRYDAKVVANSNAREAGEPDFAVLESSEPLQGQALVFSDQAEVLAPVYAFGFPGIVGRGDRQSRDMFGGDRLAVPTTVATSGTVANRMLNAKHVEVITHSAKLSEGNSGGPLLDQCGRVVGINSYASFKNVPTMNTQGKPIHVDVPTGYNWAITSAEIIRFLKSRGIEASLDRDRCR